MGINCSWGFLWPIDVPREEQQSGLVRHKADVMSGEDWANLLLWWSTFVLISVCYSHPLHFSAHFHTILLGFLLPAKPLSMKSPSFGDPMDVEGCSKKNTCNNLSSIWALCLMTILKAQHWMHLLYFPWATVNLCFLTRCQPEMMKCEKTQDVKTPFSPGTQLSSAEN